MASYYVRSSAAGLADGTSWTDAYTALATAVSGKAAGDIFYVSEDHSETASGTITSPGTSTNPCLFLCASHTGTVPPVDADLATTAVIGSANATSLTINGSYYAYGITWQAGQGSASAASITTTSSNHRQTNVNGKFYLNNTSVSSTINVFSAATILTNWLNVQIKYLSGSQALTGTQSSGSFTWRNPPVNGVSSVTAFDSGGSVPTNLLATNASGVFLFEGLDLSLMTSKTLIPAQTSNPKITIKDCKLGASTTISATQTIAYGTRVDSIRSDSANSTTRVERYTGMGKVTTSTSVYRNTGASDGVTNFSRVIVPSTRALWIAPFEAPPIAVWNETTGSSVTITVHGNSDLASSATPNNDDVWIDVCYPGDSSDPGGLWATSGKGSYLETATAYSVDGTSWNSAPAGGPFAMSVTVTPQQKGWIYVYVRVGNASGGTPTFYVDPLAVLS